MNGDHCAQLNSGLSSSPFGADSGADSAGGVPGASKAGVDGVVSDGASTAARAGSSGITGFGNGCALAGSGTAWVSKLGDPSNRLRSPSSGGEAGVAGTLGASGVNVEVGASVGAVRED